MKKILLLFLIFIPIKVYAISASSVIAMDQDSGRILYGYNYDEEALIASITKIMTCIVAIENGELDSTITVGDEIYSSYGSSIYIEVGEELTLRDLLYGLMLRSGNDAAVVIATYIAGSEENFAMLMNEEARKIGMNSSNFINASGLDNEGLGNTSTAEDMAILTRYALNNTIFSSIFGTKEYKVTTNYKTYSWTTKNKLLLQYDYITGGKTGYTDKARRTLVTTASRNNINVIVVTLNDPNDFQDHISIYENIFKNYKSVKVLDKNLKINYNEDKLYLEDDLYLTIEVNEKKNISVEYNLYDNIMYYDGDIVGEAQVFLGDTLVDSEYIYVDVVKKADHKSWWDKVKEFFSW